jgi:Domain of unknown function (DUF4132)
MQPLRRKELRGGEATAVLERGELSWLSARGRALKSAPKAVREQHAEQLRALRSEAKEIKKQLGVERLRVEVLLAEERVWPAEERRRYYRDHPPVAGIARTLLWRFRADDRTETTPGGRAPKWAEQVVLWHPIQAEPDEVRSWRATLLEREIEQPFKQAYREVHLLALAERETRIYSNRFAAHILRYPQAYALIKQRGWSVGRGKPASRTAVFSSSTSCRSSCDRRWKAAAPAARGRLRQRRAHRRAGRLPGAIPARRNDQPHGSVVVG